MKIVVLSGGTSSEREVSLSSGRLIAESLKKSGHEAYFLDAKNMEEEVLKTCQNADVVFIALHGGIGENGQLQATFDTLGIKYTGTGYVGSALAMDKDLSKRIFRMSGINTADWVLFDARKDSLEKLERVGFPCVVKPCNDGSSVGVSIVNCKEELIHAIEEASKIESSLIVEKYIKGREFSIGVLDGKTLPPIEIIPNEGFFDYENKYTAGRTREICPADLTKEQDEAIKEAALKVHQALKLGSYARIDFLLSEEDEFFCLEANTLPGMTKTSLLPQEAKAAGISYDALCEKIVHIAKK